MAAGSRPGARAHRLLALTGALAALLIQTQPAAAANSWTVTANPTTIVGDPSPKVRLTIRNTSSNNHHGNDDIGCVTVTIPSAFSVGAASIVSVTNGNDWSASKSGQKVTARADSSGDELRGDPTDDTLVLDISTGANAASGDWTIRGYDRRDCSSGSFPVKSITITVVASSTPNPTPNPTPQPTPNPTPPPTPKPTPQPTPKPTPDPTAAPTSAPTQSPAPPGQPTEDPSPGDSPTPDPSLSPEPSPSASAAASPTPSPGVAVGGPTVPAGRPPADGEHFESAISIPVDEADPSFSQLGTEVLASLGVFAWAVPGALLGAPGLLLILVILAQSMGALSWLPLVRRKIGGFGLAQR